MNDRGPQPWQAEGESWRETQIRYDSYRQMDLEQAHRDLEFAQMLANGITHVQLSNGEQMPLYEPDVDQIVYRLLMGSHSGRAGA